MLQIHRDEDDPEEEATAFDDGLEECPRCGHLIYHDSELCPRCGKYLSREELATTTSQPMWVKVGALVCLAMTLYWILHF